MCDPTVAHIVSMACDLLSLMLNRENRGAPMHIMEGYLPPLHAVGWTVVTGPFVVHGAYRASRVIKENPRAKMLLAASGAFASILSALKLPSVSGSSSHATGVGLGSILFGPWVMAVIGTIVLLFQALLLAHGGITTLGANAFSMAVVGPWVAFLLFRGLRWSGVSLSVAIFFGAAFGDLATYVTTSAQLALAFPDPSSGHAGAFLKFVSLFGFTQIPLAVVEGLLTVVVINTLRTYSQSELETLPFFAKEGAR